MKNIIFNPLSPTIFSDIAKEQAELVNRGRAGEKNKSTQLRKFYDELIMWNQRVQTERGKDERAKKYAEVAPFVKMLNAKVAYARGRNHVDDYFEKMFQHCINQITDADSLKHCKLFMESFLGFYKSIEETTKKTGWH